MELRLIFVVVQLLLIAMAVDMSEYTAGPGVETEFKSYLQEYVLIAVIFNWTSTVADSARLYATAEDGFACLTFADFFRHPEQLIVFQKQAVGILEIIDLKNELLPPTGNKHWNHLPNVTTVYRDSPLQKVYEVHGVIETTYDGGNCSIAYYKTLFPIMKDSSGAVLLLPHNRNLLAYDDFLVEPSKSPTDIPCRKFSYL